MRPGPPDHFMEWPWLAHYAAALHRDRLRRAPDLVRSGRVSSAEAARETGLAEAIAREWRAIALLEPAPQDARRFLPDEKAATLTRARIRFAALLGNKKSDPALGAWLEWSDTMLWHYGQRVGRGGPLIARLQADAEAASEYWARIRRADAADLRARGGFLIGESAANTRRAA